MARISGRVGVVAGRLSGDGLQQLQPQTITFCLDVAPNYAEISSRHELADNGNYQIASALAAGSCRAGSKVYLLDSI